MAVKDTQNEIVPDKGDPTRPAGSSQDERADAGGHAHGIPEGAKDAEAKAVPTSDRQHSETAPSRQ